MVSRKRAQRRPLTRSVHRRQLPLVDPCLLLEPADQTGFCADCEKHVHDLSAMTEKQARRFLRRHAGQPVCVRYRASPSGTIRFRPKPPVLGSIAFVFAIGGCAALGFDERWCFDRNGDARVCATTTQPRRTAKGCPLPPRREALADGGQRVRVDFSIDPDEPLFRGVVVADPARDHYERYPDRLHYEPTIELWRELGRRLRQRAEQRRRRRRR